MSWLLVFAGGGLGSLARYGIARVMPPAELAEGEIPWFTLVANILACIVLGVGIGLLSKDQLSKPLQLLLLTGFCGGFSTFSTFAAELLLMGEEGHWGPALIYVALSLLGGVGALWLALLIAR
ncbi:fluoride efflux transporter CrcB [Neolewinella agarilytica]|uniref:Fluoride-specific ion channel FluC n=1 Tax=Neolewinella agarilytica TaxID=478744 RepID=A0A1H9PAR7_9BACT|nr:fluoride efflux transporter CrcB [Neolewinella agarilytica]SER45306.1 CrcB protein [Neolewinella agarilytica]